MFFVAALRKVVSKPEMCDTARDLKPRVLKFAPDTVVYIEEGGKTFGLAIAKELGIPAVGVDIGYPLSSSLNSKKRAVRVLAWPLKELVYKFSKPTLRKKMDDTRKLGRVLLVDDSASSGRSIETAVAYLGSRGVDRCEITIAVFRCGSKAKSLVDFFETAEPVLFAGR